MTNATNTIVIPDTPEKMFLAVAVIFGLIFIGGIIWLIYSWISK